MFVNRYGKVLLEAQLWSGLLAVATKNVYPEQYGRMSLEEREIGLDLNF